MDIEISLTVPIEVFAEAEKVATNSQRKVEEVMIETLTQSFVPTNADPRRNEMEQEIEAFTAMHPQLIASHLGEYVAIHNKQLVDHDPDPVALLQRVKTNFPQKVVLRRKVTHTDEPVIHIRRPQIIVDE